jgi:hypothetical protein
MPPASTIRLLVAVLICAVNGAVLAQDLATLKDQRPYDHSGSLNIQGGPYIYTGDGSPRNQPWFWNANGQYTARFYGWDIPFSFNIGSQERRYTQPFNRYGMSPHYKWVKLHAGYRSMKFNPYTLSGLQFLGGGLELEPKGFRFGAFYGRFNKPVAQDTLASISPVTAYERTGYGVKAGVGSPRNFFDLMLVKVWDDPASIPEPVGTRIAPMENLAVGASGRISFTRRLFFTFDAGATALTPDRLAPVQVIEEVPAFANDLLTTRLGTKALFAANAGVTYTDRYLTLKVAGKQIDPGYRSLAAVFMQTDVRAVTIEPTLRLWNSKVRLSGSLGKQYDNVRAQKAATSVRTIASARISWNPSRSYGLDLNYANYGIEQQAGLRVVNDTFRVAMANRSIGLSQRLVRANNARVWTVTLVGGLQELQDLNPFGTFSTSENQVIYGNLNVMRLRTRDNLSVSGGVNVTRNTTVLSSSSLVGPMLGVSKQLAKRRITAGLNVAWNKAYRDGEDAGNTLNGNCNLQFRVNESHRFSLTVTALNNETDFAASRRFTEVRVLGGYTFLLQPLKRQKP